MRAAATPRSMWIIALLCLPFIAGTTGCAVLYQMAYGDGPKVEARFKGLQGKRVAVVCMVDPSAYGDGDTSTLIGESVARLLRNNVDKIDVVRQDKVADWMDTNNWDDAAFIEIGRGVKADMVVAIDVSAFSLHESQTLLKGRAQVATTVFDVADDGKEVFRTTDHDFTFPTSHAIPTMSANARAFQRTFIELLAENIAKNFYDYDMKLDFARDAASYAH